jgi:pyruvate formate lyase activating enzyme
MSVDDVIRIVEEDSVFYSRSGGGITVSGGEPCQHAAFVENLLRRCREHGMTTSVETTGYARWTDVERVCRHADLVLYDVKCMDAAKHRQHTGVSNARILRNLRSLSRAFPGTPVVARTPVIPGFNDSPREIEAIAEFLGTIPTVRKYELLAYHRFGESKYAHLGRRYPLQGADKLSEELMQECCTVAARFTKEREQRGPSPVAV